MPRYATTDLSDAHPGIAHVDPIFQHFGGVHQFHGPVRTVRCHEDNTLVRATLEEPGEGCVLVVDGGGSMRCALLGGNLAKLAADNGWAGVVVYGCVRDRIEIVEQPVGVVALASHPRKSTKRGEGGVDEPVEFAGVAFFPKAWLYADEDGIVVSHDPIHEG